MQSTSPQPVIPRSLQFVLFAIGGLWVYISDRLASYVAQRIINQLNLAVLEPLLQRALWLTLLLVGFTLISNIVVRSGTLSSVNALPSRPTTRQEWQRGLALGWAILLATVLPMAAMGWLQPQFWLGPRSWGLAVVSIATLALGTLAVEVAFRGYLFARLIAATGQVGATITLSLIYAIASSFRPNSTSLGVAIAFLLGILLALAYLRTNALWLGWGIHFGLSLTTGVLFGLPIGGYATYNSLVTTSVSGPDWLTGGAYGPEGSVFMVFLLLAAMVPIYAITRDYAWNYTHAPITPMGQAVIIAPPAAHVAMEESAAAKAPLVQILSSTSSSPSTMPVIEDHLRGLGSRDDES